MNIFKKIFLGVASILLVSNIALAEDSQQPGTDAWITTKVKASIYGEKLFGDTNPPSVSVNTTNGVVHLTGTVKTEAQKSQVEEFIISKKLDGLQSVSNELIVDPNI